MTIFQGAEWLDSRPDWDLVRHGGVTLFLRPQVLRDAIEDIAPLGNEVAEMDAGGWTSGQFALAEFGKALKISSSNGNGLDALADDMSDIEIPLEGGLAIVIWHFDGFYRRDHGTAHALLDVIGGCIRWNLLFGRTLITLLHSDDPQIEIPRFAYTHTMWNRREWPNDRRQGERGPLPRYPASPRG